MHTLPYIDGIIKSPLPGLRIGYGSLPVTESHGLLSQRSYGANKEDAFYNEGFWFLASGFNHA
jgi:hypothetical protein